MIRVYAKGEKVKTADRTPRSLYAWLNNSQRAIATEESVLKYNLTCGAHLQDFVTERNLQPGVYPAGSIKDNPSAPLDKNP
jgi:hypothetical protein